MFEILGVVAIILLSSSGVFQIIKFYQKKSAKDVSFVMTVFWTVGCAIFLVRAIAIKDVTFLINYAANTFICLILVIQIIYYRWIK